MEMQEFSHISNKATQRKKIKKFCGHIENISPFAGVILVSAILSLYAVVYYINDIPLRPLYIADEEEISDQFIAERAQEDLKELTSIGPRVVGTYENEILAVEFLTNKIRTIIKNAHKNQKIEFDVQTVSGVLNSSSTSVRVYESLQNVVVKVHAIKYSEHSLLVNAHFDSAPTSPGASDNGINCVTSLEVLRKITQSSDTFAHNVIFLFNGAEEVGLLGAHGFITQHRWAREVNAFINLDANGAGGKLMLFQIGAKQNWLLKYVSKIELPSAQVVGEELYESQLFPFNTDYTVFVNAGKRIGLNFAFIKNAHRYHTRYDDFENIPLSTYQHTGNAVLNLVRSLANASELFQNSKDSQTSYVYYDCFGLFLIYYTNTIGIIINVVVFLLSFLISVKCLYDFRVTSKRHVKYIGMTILGLFLGWFVSAGFVTIIAVSLDALHYNMMWYNSSWIVLGLYVIPTFLICLSFVALFKRFIKTDITFNMHAQLQLHLYRLIWTMILLIGTFLGIRSIYIFTIPVFFQTLGFLLIHLTCSQYTKRTWQILFFILTIPGTMCTMHFLSLITSTLLPSFGHLEINTELYVAFFYLFFTLLISSTYLPFITMVKKSYIVILVYSGLFVVCFAMVFTPLVFPYSDNPNAPALQRFAISYTNRIVRQGLDNNIYGRSQKLKVISSDRNANQTLQKYVTEPEFQKETDMIPFNMALQLTLNSKDYISDSQTRYNFTITGPSTMFIGIKAEENVIIANGKLYLTNKEVILKSNTTFHHLVYNRGNDSKPIVLILKTRHLPHQNVPLLRFSLAAHYLYNASSIAIPYFDKFLNQFPNWTNVDPQMIISDSMIF